MALYRVYSVSGGENLFTKISKNKKDIKNKNFESYKIINKGEYIECDAKDSVKLPFPADTDIFGEIETKIIIARYKIPYLLIGLSGQGLMSVKLPKYINENILPSLKKHIKENYNISSSFFPIEFTNEHFSTKYWGDKITTKFGYNSTKKCYIRISANNLQKLLTDDPTLEKYYTDGRIKSIKGNNQDLQYQLNDKKYTGNFVFKRNGIIKIESFNIGFFNNFVKKMIDKDFFKV